MITASCTRTRDLTSCFLFGGVNKLVQLQIKALLCTRHSGRLVDEKDQRALRDALVSIANSQAADQLANRHDGTSKLITFCSDELTKWLHR
jgi:hypothetical protein